MMSQHAGPLPYIYIPLAFARRSFKKKKIILALSEATNYEAISIFSYFFSLIRVPNLSLFTGLN